MKKTLIFAAFNFKKFKAEMLKNAVNLKLVAKEISGLNENKNVFRENVVYS